MATKSADTDYHKSLFNSLCGPLAVYGILAGYIGATYGLQAGWTWFSWHPFMMMVGFVVFAGNAVLLKKIGGYENTKMHGMLMFFCALATGFAW